VGKQPGEVTPPNKEGAKHKGAHKDLHRGSQPNARAARVKKPLANHTCDEDRQAAR